MNYKARYNRIREKIAVLPVSDKAELICCSGLDQAPEGTESFRKELPGSRTSMIIEETRGLSYPAASMIGCSFDTEMAAMAAASLAEEYRADGKKFVTGPSAAIMRSPLDGRNSRRFSEEPYLTGKMAAAFLNGFRSKGVEGCLTELGCCHSEGGKYSSDNAVDPAVFGDLYLESFRIAVEEGDALAVRLSEARMNGYRLWLSSSELKRLRAETSFDGAFVLPPGVADDAVAAVGAGTNLLPGADENAAKKLENAVKKGRLSMQSADEAAVRAYAISDSLKNSPVVLRRDSNAAFSTARRIARECMVLLKNEEGFFPLKDGEKIAVIGYAAEKKPEETFRMFSSLEPSGSTLREGLAEYGTQVVYAKGYNPDGSTNPAMVREAREALREAGKGILAVDLPSGAESDGYDRGDMKLPDGILRLADFLLEEDIPVACVVMTASPVELPFEYGMKAVFFAGHCGDATGIAAADIITGRTDASGRLSFSWPARTSMIVAADRHVYSEGYATGHRARELGNVFEGYPFGYGRSYTDVEYLGSAIDKHVIIGEHQKVAVLVRVRNNSDRAGSFVAQVYLRRGSGRMRRLVAFSKIRLLPGQIKNETIEIDASRFKEFDPSSSMKVFCAGQYTLELAVDSSDEGILESFDLSVFPKEWNTVPFADEWNEGALKRQMEETASRLDGAAVTAGEISFKKARNTISGKALYTEFEKTLDGVARPYHDKWKAALMEMPIMTVNSLAGKPIDDRTVARTVRAAVRNENGGIGFAKG